VLRSSLTLVLSAALILTAAATTSATATTRYIQCPLGSTTFLVSYCPSRLVFDLGATVTPKRLPQHTLAPVGVKMEAGVHREDGSHPSALREATVDIDKDLTIDATGLPICASRQLKGHNTEVARRVCRSAIVGRGLAHVAIGSSEQQPIPLATTLFNGGVRDGTTTVFIHAFADVPTLASVVGTVKLRSIHGGLEAVVRVPRIAAGSGSLLDFSFQMKRLFRDNGEMRSYLMAKCPDDVFKVKASALLKNEARTPGVAATTAPKGSLSVPCTPTD
jgi:hypothetical protein